MQKVVIDYLQAVRLRAAAQEGATSIICGDTARLEEADASRKKQCKAKDAAKHMPYGDYKRCRLSLLCRQSTQQRLFGRRSDLHGRDTLFSELVFVLVLYVDTVVGASSTAVTLCN